jgi:hypothetical protein
LVYEDQWAKSTWTWKFFRDAGKLPSDLVGFLYVVVAVADIAVADVAETVVVAIADTVAAYLLLLTYDVTRMVIMKKCKPIWTFT